MAVFGFIVALMVSGIRHLWYLVVMNGVPFWSGVKAFIAVMGCLAVNGYLAWIMTRSWKKDEIKISY